MKNFNSLDDFNDYLKKVIANEDVHAGAMLEAMAQHIEDDAKRKFGIYQEEIGSFPKWKELAEATKNDRIRKGFEPNNPLYRTGDLMYSIYHKVDVKNKKAVVGSDEEIMVYQELGTHGKHPIPERPVLGPAAFESKKYVEKIAGLGLRVWLLNDKPISKNKQI